MSNLDKTANKEKTPSQKPLVDEYGNLHYLADELARGGQGVVFYTTDVLSLPPTIHPLFET